MQILQTIALWSALALAAAAQAQQVDWTKVDAAMGRNATVAGEVHRYGFPRSDLQVTLDGVTIKPPLALGGSAPCPSSGPMSNPCAPYCPQYVDAPAGRGLDGGVVEDPDLELSAADLDGKLMQLGRRNWARLRS